jgi:hypothetical protein
MFVPSIESLSNKLNFTRSSLDADGTVRVPGAMLKFLLQIALTATEFNEGAYLKENPDVAEAVERGDIESAYLHYIGFGYFEGRPGGGPQVDEDWYLKKYPDVASGIRNAQINSASQHFHRVGAAEGRSPSADQLDSATQWKRALRR